LCSVVVKVKVTVPLLCVCAFAWESHPRNDLYCAGWSLNPTHSLT